MLTRRGILGGLGSFLAAPAIVRVASIMPVKALPVGLYGLSPMVLTLADWARMMDILERQSRSFQGYWVDTNAFLELHGQAAPIG